MQFIQNSSAPNIMSILSDLLKCGSANFNSDGINFSFNRNDDLDIFPIMYGKIKYEMLRRKSL